MKSLLSYTFRVFIFCFLVPSLVQGQKIFLNGQFNNATFAYNSNSNLNFKSIPSYGFSFGLSKSIGKSGFDYLVGIGINNYKVSSETEFNRYSWNATFCGISNSIVYDIFKGAKFKFKPYVGVSLLYLLNGEQIINQSTFNLKSQSEFKGFWLQPIFGLIIEKKINDFTDFNLGVEYSVARNFSNKTQEKVGINNIQLRAGIQFNLK
jgi:hypothetical protein